MWFPIGGKPSIAPDVWIKPAVLPTNNVNRTYGCGAFSRINLMISCRFGERLACFFE